MTQTALTRMPAAKRQALISAAAEEFAAHSFDQASLNRVISNCRMSKSSFYHAIDSKESLLSLVVGELSAEAARDWTPPAPSDFADEFWATAARVFDDVLRVWPQSRALEQLWNIVHANRDNPGVVDLARSYENWVSAVLEVGRRSGAIDQACPSQLQALSASTLLVVFDDWALRETAGTPPTDGSLEAAAGHQFRLLRRLLEARVDPA